MQTTLILQNQISMMQAQIRLLHPINDGHIIADLKLQIRISRANIEMLSFPSKS